MYDAIVIGARCAGSPTAMLIARKGYRVLLVDKATFPSDTFRAHYIQLPGVIQLKRWGLLERVISTNCPPVRARIVQFGDLMLSGTPPYPDGIPGDIAPRRKVLDKLLVDAAMEAGVEVREGFTVNELLMDGERVIGIQGKTQDGAALEAHAPIVVGADGLNSLVARTVGALEYNITPTMTFCYYTYWADVNIQELIFCQPGKYGIIVCPTNDQLTLIAVVAPVAQYQEFRQDMLGNYLRFLEQPSWFGERIRTGRIVERMYGTAHLPNLFRKPYGPGWALVGDAGYHKDPLPAFGISDAFRDAELLADAIHAGLSGQQPLDQALGEYEQKRNEAAMPRYDATIQATTLQPLPPQSAQLFAALRGNQEATNQFLGVRIGTVPAEQFFAPDNMARIMQAAEPALAEASR